jgi:hypothetical protein
VFEFLQNNKIPHIIPVIKRGKQIKKILKGNKARREQYVMKNSKKKILLDIVIDVKYLKGKRGKRDEKISVLWFLESNGLQERLVQFTEEDLLLNRRTG